MAVLYIALYALIALFISALVFTITGCNPEAGACYKYDVHNAVTEGQSVYVTGVDNYYAYIRFRYGGRYVSQSDAIEDGIITASNSSIISQQYIGGSPCHMWVYDNEGSAGFRRESYAWSRVREISGHIGSSVHIIVDRTDHNRCLPYSYGYNNWLKGTILFCLCIIPLLLVGYSLRRKEVHDEDIHTRASLDISAERVDLSRRICSLSDSNIPTTAIRMVRNSLDATGAVATTAIVVSGEDRDEEKGCNKTVVVQAQPCRDSG
jgi:hypothetical protein